MKQVLLLFTGVILTLNVINAQSPGCAGATSLDSNWAFTQLPSPEDTSIDYGCIATSTQWIWYGYFSVCQGGTLNMMCSSGSSSYDVDVVVWGPFTSLANICSQLDTFNIAACASTSNPNETVSLGTVSAPCYYMVAAVGDTDFILPYVQWNGTAIVGNCPPPPPGPGCAGAVDLNITNFSGQGSLEDTTINYGCVTPAGQYIWYGYFTVCQGGTLDVGGWVSTSGDDEDIVVWGPFPNSSNLCTQLTAANIAGCGATPGNDIVNLGTVTTGQVYMVSVACDTSTFVPTFIHNGSAVITGNCTPPPPCYPGAGIESLCLVTVDSATQEYQLIWNEIAGNSTAHYGIMKADYLGNPQQIDTVNITSLSEYIDASADPNVHTEQYSIITYDTCGTWWQTGAYIQPVFCQSSLSTQGTVNVAWSSYIDISGNGPVYYVIYRGATPNNMVSIDTVGTWVNNYTDVNPLIGTSYYKIGTALYSACVPMRLQQSSASVYPVQSFSNAAPITVAGIVENSLTNVSLYPNPSEGTITVNNVWEQSTLRVYDVAGRIVKEEIITGATSQQIDLTSLEQGMYSVMIENENGYYRQGIVIQR